MNAARCFLLGAFVLGACGGDDVDDQMSSGGEGTSSSSSATTSSSEGSGEGAGTVTPGDPCPLVGMFRECSGAEGEGIAYCDLIGGELEFGPCLVDPDCGLTDAPTCGDSPTGDFVLIECELVQGVPTLIYGDDCGFGDETQ